MECIRDECDSRQIIKSDDGKCETCPDYMKPDGDAKECFQQECDFKIAILTVNGECEMCPAYSRPEKDGKSCSPEICLNDERIDIEGRCVKCEPYTRVVDEIKCEPE